MHALHEGEIVFKEKYGSSSNARLYVKPPEQENVVMVDENKREGFTSIFSKIFLPQGYPDSVSMDYLSYQIWDTAQAFCSTITGTIATKEVLKGVGVGDTNATPLAATCTWVLKDGCGHLGKIIFAYTHGTYLDAYSKKWRLYADTLNDAAMCIELALPVFKDFSTVVLCVTTVMKAIVGVAGGASRAAMTQHHAKRGNMADVSAKDAAQETAVNLVASFVALLIMTIFGDSLAIFSLLVVLHIVFNYSAVRAVCLRTMNEPRFLEVIKNYLQKETIPTPCDVNKSEPLLFYQIGTHLLDYQLCGFKIKTGRSVNKLMKSNQKASYLKDVLEAYEYNDYVLFPDISRRTMYVLLKETSTNNITLCAYFHAVILSTVICAINDVPLNVYKDPDNEKRSFAMICTTLQKTDWAREEINKTGVFNYEPSIDLIIYINKIVQKEWHQVKTLLIRTGWDLSKHLLIVDEWRLCAEKIVTDVISVDNLLSAEDLLSSRLITFDDVKSDMPNLAMRRDTYTIEPEPIIESLNLNPKNTDSKEAHVSNKKN